ncbi:MAG: hypothetical protein WD757_01470 [Actinomycetota bacterium]
MARLTDDEIEEILSGRPVEGRAAESLASWTADLRAELLGEPRPEAARGDIDAMARALRDGRPSGAEVTQLAPSAREPRRRGLAAAAVAAAFVLVTGGLASAGAFPAPAQDALARVVEPLGIDLPDPTGTPLAAEAGLMIAELAKSVASEGCEGGQAVAAAASAIGGEGAGPGGGIDPCSQGPDSRADEGSGGPDGHIPPGVIPDGVPGPPAGAGDEDGDASGAGSGSGGPGGGSGSGASQGSGSGDPTGGGGGGSGSGGNDLGSGGGSGSGSGVQDAASGSGSGGPAGESGAVQIP